LVFSKAATVEKKVVMEVCVSVLFREWCFTGKQKHILGLCVHCSFSKCLLCLDKPAALDLGRRKGTAHLSVYKGFCEMHLDLQWSSKGSIVRARV
jgi:hypothetical protein